MDCSWRQLRGEGTRLRWLFAGKEQRPLFEKTGMYDSRKNLDFRAWPDYCEATDKEMESDLEMDPKNVKSWLLYLKAKKNVSSEYRFLLYIRALEELPRSYKLWTLFLNEVDVWLEFEQRVSDFSDELLDFVEMVYVKAVGNFPRMLKMRLRYTDFLWRRRRLITQTRREFDSILRDLPLTQHHQVWERFLSFARETRVETTILATLRRYVQLFPEHRELLVAQLAKLGRWDECALVWSELCSDDHFESMVEGKTKQTLWVELCLLISKHASDIRSVDGNLVIRSGIKKLTEAVSSLWCALATFFLSLGSVEGCVAVFEEGLEKTQTVQDFGHIFHAFSNFLRSFIEKSLNSSAPSCLLPLLVNKLESLVDNRAEMLSSVRIRRNPHNVFEWLNRIAIFCKGGQGEEMHLGDSSSSSSSEEETSTPTPAGEPAQLAGYANKIKDPVKVIRAFSEAVGTIDPLRAIGKPSVLWIEFARFYELYDDLPNARTVLGKACLSTHKNLESLVAVWCERIELELRYDRFSEALRLAREAVVSRRRPEFDDMAPKGEYLPQTRLNRSIRLWSLRADLEASFGSLETLRETFEQMFALKVITVEQILIYAQILEERKHFEDAFQVYEKGIDAFKWPYCADIRLVYLSKFVSRFGNRKVDRARELFEEALCDVPPQFALRFFFMYAKFEEHFGLIRHALAIYHRATRRVPDDRVSDVYRILISLTQEYFGLVKTRPIFVEAMESVPDTDVVEIGLRFAEMETALMDIDRARAIYEHVSQFSNPTGPSADLWQKWREFEISHGDEDTFKEMIRRKRAVSAQFEEANALTFDEQTMKAFEEEAEREQEQENDEGYQARL